MDAKKARLSRYFAGAECPECNNTELDRIEDNGCTGKLASFHCTDCGCQWDAEQFL